MTVEVFDHGSKNECHNFKCKNIEPQNHLPPRIIVAKVLDRNIKLVHPLGRIWEAKPYPIINTCVCYIKSFKVTFDIFLHRNSPTRVFPKKLRIQLT
jgi:hypothetical protein